MAVPPQSSSPSCAEHVIFKNYEIQDGSRSQILGQVVPYAANQGVEEFSVVGRVTGRSPLHFHLMPEILESVADGVGGSHLGALLGWRLDVLHVFFRLDLNDCRLPVDHSLI